MYNYLLSSEITLIDISDWTSEWRFNTTLNKLEYYDGSNWYTVDDEAAAGSTITALNNFDTKL